MRLITNHKMRIVGAIFLGPSIVGKPVNHYIASNKKNKISLYSSGVGGHVSTILFSV